MTLDNKTLKYIEHYKAIKEKKKAEMANEPYKVGYKKPPVSIANLKKDNQEIQEGVRKSLSQKQYTKHYVMNYAKW